MLLWLTARMNCLCTCCKRKQPLGVHYQGSCCFPSSQTEWTAPVGDIACLVGQQGLRPMHPVLPVVLELCFSAAVRSAHKYGSQETRSRGGRVLLSHHSYIMKSVCLSVHTHTHLTRVCRGEEHSLSRF